MSCGLQRLCPAAEAIESVSFFRHGCPEFMAEWNGWGFAPLPVTPRDISCPQPPTTAIAAPVLQESVAPPPPARHTFANHPPPHPNPGIAPRCQSHTSTSRSDQPRTDQGSSIRARLRLSDMQHLRDCPAQDPRERGLYAIIPPHNPGRVHESIIVGESYNKT